MKKNNKKKNSHEVGFIRDSIRWLFTGKDSFTDEDQEERITEKFETSLEKVLKEIESLTAEVKKNTEEKRKSAEAVLALCNVQDIEV